MKSLSCRRRRYPLNDAGKKKYAENQAGLKNGSIVDRARRYCTPDGLPRTLATPYPFQIHRRAVRADELGL
jgi:hypothetical protein